MPLSQEERDARAKERMLQKFKEKRLQACKDMVSVDFQSLRRLECQDENGILTCVTCGKRGPNGANIFDAGHYIQRGNSATLYDPRNVWPQCKRCNDPRGLAGNTAKYRIFLLDELGEEELEKLEFLGRTVHQFTKPELVELRWEFRRRIKAIEKELGNA